MEALAFGGMGIFFVFFVIIFTLVIGTFIFIAVKGMSQWSKNNHSPVLTIPAEVDAKRTDTSGGHGDPHQILGITSHSKSKAGIEWS